jgi:CMP-N-acetylneuraminic acid synthetase
MIEAGLIYISTKDAILNEKEYITDDLYPYITDEIGSHIDIDYESDLELAELILKANKNKITRL